MDLCNFASLSCCLLCVAKSLVLDTFRKPVVYISLHTVLQPLNYFEMIIHEIKILPLFNTIIIIIIIFMKTITIIVYRYVSNLQLLSHVTRMYMIIISQLVFLSKLSLLFTAMSQIFVTYLSLQKCQYMYMTSLILHCDHGIQMCFRST